MHIDDYGKASGSLVGVDGNAFSVVGYTKKRLQKQGWPHRAVKHFTALAFGGDYNHLLTTCLSVLDDTNHSCPCCGQ